MNPTKDPSTHPQIGLAYKARRVGLTRDEMVVYRGESDGKMMVTDTRQITFYATRSSGLNSVPTFSFNPEDKVDSRHLS